MFSITFMYRYVFMSDLVHVIAGYSLHTLHVTETLSSTGTKFSMLFTKLHKFTYEK
jgi:hypothetical protein